MNSNQQRYDLIIGMQAKELVNGVKSSKKSLEGLKQNFKDTLDVLNTSPKQYGLTDTKQIIAARKEVEKLIREVEKLQAAGKTTLAGSGTKGNQATARQSAQLMAGVSRAQGLIQSATPSAIEKEQLKIDAAKTAALSKMQNKAITLRYALYDVGSAAQSASDALLGFTTAVVGAAAAQEAAFSQIQKTLVGEVSTEELNQLKNELIDLSRQIPVSFDELAKIGMLGSQLGIEAENIAKFTDVTAKFSAITGMSVEETAMSFGKIANILGLSSEQYEALGSSIAAVGVKTAATEQQIISTAGQIGAVAKAAGFSASQVIGLSASFASLRIAPEEARGVIVRTFSEMSQAALSFNKANGVGGEKLKVFANIAGITSKEFAEGWGSKGSGAFGVFQKFIDGLRKGDIPKELQRISLDGVRTSKGLTALANGFDLVNNSIAIAQEAGAEGTFLDKAFGTIVEDIASKLKMLENSFQNLAAAAGGGALFEVIGTIVDALTRLNKAMTDFISLPVVGPIANFVVLIAGIGAAVTALIATLAIAGGGFLAIKTAFLSAVADGLIFKGTLLGLIAEFLGISVASKPAAAGITGIGAASKVATVGVNGLTLSMRLLKTAFIGTGIGLVVLLLSELINHFVSLGEESKDSVTGLDEVQQGLKEVMTQTAATTQEMVDFMNQALGPIKNLVSLEDSLYSLGQALGDSANDFDVYSEAGRNNINALMSTISAITTQAQGDQQTIANNLNALMQYMMASGLGTEAAFTIIRNAIAVTGLEAQAAVVNFASLTAGMQVGTNNVAKSAGRAQSALEKMTKAFEKAFEVLDASTDLEGSFDAFGESLQENGKAINSFTDTGRSNLKSLRDVIFSLKDSLAGNPQALANTLASLREAMIRVGITSQTAFDMVSQAIKATGRSGAATNEVIEAMAATINQAAQASKKLTTITDYVSDLASVLNEALNNRYARQDARDSISSAWNSISESAQEARKSIDEANASINGMRANRSVLEYQLRVAVRYGDTLRAEAIRAKIAQTDSEIADKQKELSDAQEEANKSLVGNSKYAIENRATVRDLVGSYNEYLTSLAATGISSEVLNAKAAELANEFLEQGTQMGFAREELLDYTDAFKKDFTTVINNLPKDITLNINTDPALQAVIDFVKDANAELARLLSATAALKPPTTSIPGVTVNTGNTSTGPGVTGPAGPAAPAAPAVDVNTIKNTLDAAEKAYDAQAKIVSDLSKLLKKEQDTAKFGGSPSQRSAAQTRANNVQKDLDRANSTLATLKATRDNARKAADQAGVRGTGGGGGGGGGFLMAAEGGFVRGPGSGTSDSINAKLSNGEYVLRANAVKYYGTDFMNSLNQMQVQMGGSSGGTGGVVYLSPEDRALLRSAIDRPISLYTENTTIASTANAGNVLLAQRGSR
jgi:TP901 family phage tail tape measure protein